MAVARLQPILPWKMHVDDRMRSQVLASRHRPVCAASIHARRATPWCRSGDAVVRGAGGAGGYGLRDSHEEGDWGDCVAQDQRAAYF